MLNTQKFNGIYGWFNEDEGRWLYHLALGCNRVLEIGAWQGRSTYCLLSALRDTPDSMRIAVSVDQYVPLSTPIPYYSECKGSGRAAVIAKFKQNISEFTACHHVLMDEASATAYPKLRPGSYDLAFIDGDHSYPAVKLDITECLKLVRPGGIICGHDYRSKGNEGVVRAVDELLPHRKLTIGSCWQWQLPLAN